MRYINTFQTVLRYIDENLSNEINAEVLAGIAGFSTYHFCRMFQWHVGYSVMEYVRQRRLAFAVSELSSGRRLIDIAMDYGFETHSGFSKAFKRYYGVSPEMYRIHAKADKPALPDILRMNKYLAGGIVMKPKFVSLPAIKLAGYALKTRNVDNENSREIPEFWAGYLTDGRAGKLHQSDFAKNHAEYGACFPEDPQNGEFSYVIGVEVKDGIEIPKEYHVCELPPAVYAVFSTPPCDRPMFSQNIQGTWQYIMNDWFPSSGYEYTFGCVDFELYGEKCMGDKDLVCEIYIPVTKNSFTNVYAA